MENTQRQVLVEVDHYIVAPQDLVLYARLSGSFALCISDEVHEAGALLHLQAGRPGLAADADLTDNTLSMDLLLLDRCMAELRAAEPLARHWRARFVAHVNEAAGGAERLTQLQAFFEAALEDAGVELESGALHEGPAQWLSFRPSLRQLRTEAEA